MGGLVEVYPNDVKGYFLNFFFLVYMNYDADDNNVWSTFVVLLGPME